MVSNIEIENAQIRFRNFSGRETKFNNAGRRNFCVLISEDDAQALADIGWNIKYLRAQHEGEIDQPYLQVKVTFEPIAPSIFLVTGKRKVKLNEDTVGQLDFAELSNVDLIIRPYEYDFNGQHGISAYVKTMYATIVEDQFASKYDFDEEEIPFN